MTKYADVRDHLRERICHMSPGDRLPSETELCETYAVSRITARRAVDDLVLEGRLTRQQGRGTFVADPLFVQHARESFADQVTGFFRQQRSLGRDVTTKVLRNELGQNRMAAEALGFNAAHKLITLERLRYVDNSLHQHVVTYLPTAYDGVLQTDFSAGSLFDYLVGRYGVELARNDLVIRIDRVHGLIARALDVVEGEAVLAMDSTVYDQAGNPVAFGTARLTPENGEVAFRVSNR
ncbi:MAG: GntR family transcriptional regulator [Bifidobacteriaceae bacterium]|nr:GntR family transcriptional regulator [Bifidobacteriaceae bacterium]